MKKFTITLLSLAFLLTQTLSVFANTTNNTNSVVSIQSNSSTILLQGKPVVPDKRSLLMKQLKREYFKPTKTRRFEIVFFISLPVTLWLTYTLMEFMIRSVPDKNNPNHDFQTPHYVFIYGSSLATSFYIAYHDSIKYDRMLERNRIKEKKIEVPIVGIRF